MMYRHAGRGARYAICMGQFPASVRTRSVDHELTDASPGLCSGLYAFSGLGITFCYIPFAFSGLGITMFGKGRVGRMTHHVYMLIMGFLSCPSTSHDIQCTQSRGSRLFPSSFRFRPSAHISKGFWAFPICLLRLVRPLG